MPNFAHLVRVEIREEQYGMFSATSPDEPDLFVCAKGEDGIREGVTVVLERLYSERLGRSVRAVPSTWENDAEHEDIAADAPWTVVPTELLAARAASGCL